jgi:hypothetical protein
MTHELPGDVRPPAKTPLEGQTYLAFEADFPAERARIGDDTDPENPAGREVAAFLLGALDPSRAASRIWKEEGVGWAFHQRIGRITVNVLVQYVDHWLVIVKESADLPRSLRGSQYDAAVFEACERIHRAVAALPHVTRMRWLTDAEYESSDEVFDA